MSNETEVTETDLLESAACLWEHALNETSDAGTEAGRAMFMHGTAEVRSAVISGARAAHLAWLESPKQGDESFDWDFVPGWFNNNFDWATLAYDVA